MKIILGLNEIKTLSFWRAALAEFLGLLFFVLLVTTAVLSWSDDGVDNSANILKISVGVGLAITCLVQAFGHVSGGHLNPAVSVAMIVVGKISVIKGLVYIVAQSVGGIFGAILTYSLTTDETREGLGVPHLGKCVSIGQGFVTEFFFTFLLVFFIFSITDENKTVDSFGVALGIGVVVVVAHVSAIPLTGCSINPARAFGPAVAMNNFKDHWIYWIAPLLGGIAAALSYTFVFYVEDPKSKTYKPRNEQVQLQHVSHSDENALETFQ